MKRANNLIQTVADADNLRWAFWKARKGKSHSRPVEIYRRALEQNLAKLRLQILQGEVEVGQYTYFKIYDPKERQIAAPSFQEQVLHHALMNVCHDRFEKAQVFDSYVSRKGKGTHAALARAKENTRRFTYFLKLDVYKFFDSIHHTTLMVQLDKIFKDKAVLQIFYKIINSYEVLPGRGVPIGNLTSQYFANHYLADLDHFIKEQLGIKAYVRYMDDMVLWHKDKAVLKNALQSISAYVQNQLQCRLKPPLMNHVTNGLPFLGYVVRPYDVRLSLRSRRRFVKKLRLLEEKYRSGEWSESTCQRRALSLTAFTQHANAKAFRGSVILQDSYYI